MKNAEQLIHIQEEYIKFLETEVGNTSSFAHTYGWNCPKEVYEKGCKLREEIEKLKNE